MPKMSAPVKSSHTSSKSLESWIWDAACSIRGAKDAPKYKDYILPLIFTKRLCDVFDDEINRIAKEVGSRKKAFQLAKADHKLVRFYLPLVPDDPEQPVWYIIRKLSDKIGEGVTTHMRSIARENPLLQGIIDRVDFNATTHGQRDIDDDRLSNLIEAISTKRLGLDDVEADIIGKSYEYLHNQRLGLIVDLHTKRLSKRFLFNVFNHPHLRLEVAKTSTGSKVKHTSPTKLRAVKVGIPPTSEEQEEIASALSKIQQRIGIATNKKSQLQDLFRTLLHELMTAMTRIHKLDFGPQPGRKAKP